MEKQGLVMSELKGCDEEREERDEEAESDQKSDEVLARAGGDAIFTSSKQ